MSSRLPDVSDRSRLAALRAALGLGTSMIVVLSNAVTGVVVSQILGPEGRGSIAVVVVFAALTLTLGSVGIPEAISTRHVAGDDRAWSQLLSLSFLLSIPIAVVLIPVVLLVASTEAGTPVRWQLAVLALSMPLRSLGISGTFVLLAKGRVSLHQLLSVSVSATVLMSVLGALALGYRSTGSLGWAATVGSIAPSIVQAKFGSSVGFALPTSDLVARALGFGAKSWLGAAANNANQRADVLVVSSLADSDSVGVLANASSMASLALVAVSAFGPRVRWAIAKNHRSGLRRWLGLGIGMSIALGVLGSVGAFYLFGTIYGAEFESGRAVAATLVLIAPLLASSRFLAIVVAMNGLPGRVAVAETIGFGIGISLLIGFYSSFGLWAVVIGSVAGYLAASVIEWRSARSFIFGGDV